MHADNKEHLHALVTSFDTGMLTTRRIDDELHSRPMAIAKVDNDCNLWLLTHAPSEKTAELFTSPECSLSFQRDPSVYLVLSGTAEILRDENLAGELWNESYREWFPQGATDSNLAVIRFIPQIGEYWDNSGLGNARYAYEFAKSLVSGSQHPTTRSDSHGTVNLA